MQRGLLLVIASSTLAAASPASIVIDTFVNGPVRESRTTVGGTAAPGQFSVVPLWERRDLTLWQDTNDDPGAARNTVAIRRAKLTYSSDEEVSGRVSLIYSNTLPNGNDFNANRAFRLSFTNLDRPITIIARAEGPVSGQGVVVASSTQNVAASLTPFEVTFASWNQPTNWSNITLISFGFTLPAGTDFEITKVEAVPEPATIAALGLGAAAFLRRKRG